MTYLSVLDKSTFLDREHISYEVTCVVVKSESWVRPEHNGDTVLLGHERLHFDIAECKARELRSRLRTIMSFDGCAQRIPTLRDSVNAEWKRVQDRYDAETSHGTIAMEQARWSKKIAQRLDSLSAYTAPRFVVELNP